MKPLKVALFHFDHPRALGFRSIGMWSYPVPEFEVVHFPQKAKVFEVNRRDLVGCDLIWQEDYRCYGKFWGDEMPFAYWITDSTLSEEHYQVRRGHARTADLIMVDWDRLSRFSDLGVPVRRCGHCVNDLLFRDYGEGKQVDVGFYCGQENSQWRQATVKFLGELCNQRGWSFDSHLRPSEEYAKAMARTRVVVQSNRTPTTRAHRTFDAMATGAALCTEALPQVDGEYRTAGEHYVEWYCFEDLAYCLEELLSGKWQLYAEAGKALVAERHTWRVRAQEVRKTLAEVFPRLREPVCV